MKFLTNSLCAALAAAILSAPLYAQQPVIDNTIYTCEEQLAGTYVGAKLRRQVQNCVAIRHQISEREALRALELNQRERIRQWAVRGCADLRNTPLPMPETEGQFPYLEQCAAIGLADEWNVSGTSAERINKVIATRRVSWKYPCTTGILCT